jgi:hypothetical protein
VLVVIGLPPTLVGLMGLLLLALPGRASLASEAPAARLNLTWDAPAGCASREDVQAEITRLLGGHIAIAHGGDLDARAAVERGAVWSVSLVTRHGGRTGRRTLEAPSCESAAQATALIVALMIDPDAVAANAHEDQAAPVPAPTPTIPVAARSEQPLELVANLHSQVSYGTLPEIDVGVGIGVALSGRRWRAALRGSYGLRRDQVGALPSGSGAYGRFNITTGALTGCYRVEQSALAFGPCVVGEAGVVSAEGHGASAGFGKHAPWVALGPGGYLSVALGRHLRGSVEAEVLLPLYRPEYVFQDLPGVAFKAPSVGGRALLSIGWRF